MGETDPQRLVELLAVTQQHYYGLKPVAAKNPSHAVPEGTLEMLRRLESRAKEVLGDLPTDLVPPVSSVTYAWGDTRQMEYQAALMWVGGLHAYLMTKLPPEKEQARKQFGLTPPE